VYTRERKHIGSKWSRVTCLALPLATAHSLERRPLGDSQNLRRVTIAIGNRQHKQINKQYIKQYLMTKKNYTNRCYSSLRTRERKNHLNQSYGLEGMNVSN
jgi:hypothetical protein